MTARFWLDWVALAVSLFNALLLLWLALMVFLNAERRVWGIWLSSSGLMLGAIFFASHSVLLGYGISAITPKFNLWWRFGFLAVVVLPFMWYAAVLWYAGYWDYLEGQVRGRRKLNQRQSGWFLLMILYGSILFAVLALANPLSTLNDLANGQSAATLTIPALILAYLLYTLLCMGLSVDALRQPEKSGRLMGDLARARARRWLTATSVLLLAVSLLVGWAMIWSMKQDFFQPLLIRTLGWIDLVIATLIAISVLLLGQAVVSYEVFTGKTLPRRGMVQFWQQAVILSASFSLLASWSLTVGLRPVYTLLISAFIMITFFAVLNRRAYDERQRLIENLRPFAASQKMIDNLLKEDSSTGHFQDDESSAPFQALCANVLETTRAGLFPYGPLALLAGQSFFFPPGSAFSPPDLDSIAAKFYETTEVGITLEPDQAEVAIFAVPLWREGGLCGMIFLGQKQGDRPYTQEEIEIAQATGERLVDAQASAEMARRLISLQRQHLVAGQVNDQRVRQQVHDEILPQVHTIMLDLASSNEVQSENGRVLELLQGVHNQLSNLLQSMPSTTAAEVKRSGLVAALQRTVNNEMEGAFDEVVWQIEPQAEALASELPPLIAEVVYSATREGVRNAARHARGENAQSQLRLQVVLELNNEDQLRITVEDNGIGFEDQYLQGTNTQQPVHEELREEKVEDQQTNGGNADKDMQRGVRSVHEGSRQGLALHSTLMAVIGGSLTVSSKPKQYTRLTLVLPRAAWG
jgi:signal transduction histidine kinase